MTYKFYKLTALLCLFYICPATSQVKWVTKASLPNLLTECSSIVLNGKIYIIGGLEPGAVSTTRVHVYDPVLNTWDTAAPLPIALHHAHCAAAMGKIYILGGYTSNPFQPVSNSYEYNPATDSWTEKAPVPTVRGAATASEIGGKIYVIGGAGYNLTQSTNVNEAYDPVTNTWESKGPMPTSRDHHAASSLDTLIYVAGGRNFSANIGSTQIVEVYSPSTDFWYEADPLLFKRSGFSMVTAGGRLIAIGGEWFAPGQSGLTAQIETYNPALNKWEFLTTMNTTRHGMGCGVAGDTIYTISGGVSAGYSYSDINEAFVFESSIGIQHISETAKEFVLYQNYPNPFNPVTKIKFSLPSANNVIITVYDVLGKAVTNLVNQRLNAGSYETEWNGENYPSGIYFYRIDAGSYSLTRKMTLIK